MEKNEKPKPEKPDKAAKRGKPWDTWYWQHGKRILDCVIGVFALCILIIPMLIIALLIHWIDRIAWKDVIFVQARAGMRQSDDGEEVTFPMHKFRTMRMDTPENIPTDHLKNADQHITKLGGILRKLSLDELPQIVDVLRGDMSFVGPRPALPEQINLLRLRRESKADQMKPGMFGLAQKKGRDQLPEKRKAYFDGEYVKHCSFGMDAYCFFGCLIDVLFHRGIVEGEQEPDEQDKQDEQKETK